jgi:hypothetical protein
MLADDNYSDPPLLGTSGNDLLEDLRPCELHPDEQLGIFGMPETDEITDLQYGWQTENGEGPQNEAEDSVTCNKSEAAVHALRCYVDKVGTQIVLLLPDALLLPFFYGYMLCSYVGILSTFLLF